MRVTGLPETATVLTSRPRLVWTRRRPVLTAVSTIAAVLVVLVFTAGPATAAAPPVQIAGSLDQVLDNIRVWLIGILAGLATVCLTVAGARYLIASGNPGELEKAKTAVKAACMGYGLAMLAPVVVSILESIVSK
jgi:hypothetical protein